MPKDPLIPTSKKEGMEEKYPPRREFLAKFLMGIGLLASLGALAVEGLLFLWPKKRKPPMQKIYAGKLKDFPIGSIKTLYDLQGNPIMVKRNSQGIKAFSSVCPHLGCKVHWEEKNKRFFCPCHGGAFDQDGNPTAGPPKDANQRLIEVPLEVDKISGIVYLKVKKPEVT